MKAKIGINGLGRIGRMVLRSIFEENHKDLKINHINNRADIKIACELIKRDSVHGNFKGKVYVVRLTMPLSHSVNHTVKQLQTMHF